MRKVLKTLCIILLIISLVCTLLGFIYKNKKPAEKPVPVNPLKDITMKFYLEEVESETMPENKLIVNEENGEQELEKVYKYDHYECTNNIKLIFDESNWTYTIEKGEATSGECELYFNKSNYEVSFTVIDGYENENNPKTVERFKDGKFTIYPNDGYEYSTSQCSNDKKAEYDSSKNILTLSAVNSDIACKVTFVKKKLTYKLTVKEGNGATKGEQYFGEEVSLVVTPKNGYEFVDGNIKCTNDQTATFENNNFVITKLTKNTECTISFTKAAITKYTIKISNPDEFENISITEGNANQVIQEGSTGSITLTSSDGTEPKLKCDTQVPEASEFVNNNKTFTWMDVTKNITCKIELMN